MYLYYVNYIETLGMNGFTLLKVFISDFNNTARQYSFVQLTTNKCC